MYLMSARSAVGYEQFDFVSITAISRKRYKLKTQLGLLWNTNTKSYDAADLD